MVLDETQYTHGMIFDVIKREDGKTLVCLIIPNIRDYKLLITRGSIKAYEDIKPLMRHNVRIEYCWRADDAGHWLHNIWKESIEYLGVTDLGVPVEIVKR
jgi:hypothetical protein